MASQMTNLSMNQTKLQKYWKMTVAVKMIRISFLQNWLVTALTIVNQSKKACALPSLCSTISIQTTNCGLNFMVFNV